MKPPSIALLISGLASLAPALLFAQCVPAPANLAAWWNGNGSGIELAGGNHGTLGSSVSFTNGEVGQAFLFVDNANSFVTLPASSAWMPANNQLTLECWIKPNFNVAGDKLDTIIAKRDGCGTLSYHFGVYKGHQGKVGPLYFGSSAGGADSTSNVPNDGQFHHVAVTFDGGKPGGNIRFYIDGQPAGVFDSQQQLPLTTEAPVLGRHASCGYYSSAVIDEISLYHRELAAAEIQGIFNAGTSGKCPPPLAGAAVPYFTDFERGVDPGWSPAQTDGGEPDRFTRFLGRLGSTSAFLALTGLTAGVSYTMGFDFYAIDSWDGGNTNSGDVLTVAVDAATLFRESFANYNGNPPGGAQSFARPPDEGRANFGFVSTSVDAIYRNIEVTFTASNTTALVTFRGNNLQDVTDESWGLDNVRIRPTLDTTATIIHATTLPTANSTNSVAIDHFLVAASRPLQAASATNAANWSLREAGPNGTLGNADDVTLSLAVSLVPVFNTGRSFLVTPLNSPLAPGRYRFSSGPGLLDTNGAAVAPFTQDFVIVHPLPGRIEAAGSDAIASASDLALTETPIGSGFLTALGAGSFSGAGDIDYWRFDAEAGDYVTVRLETQGEGTSPQLYLQNVSGANLQTVSGSAAGVATMQRYRFASPGTYYLRVWSDQRPAPYQLRVDLGRIAQLESEPNDASADANLVNLSFTPGLAQGRVEGTLSAGSDYYALLTLNPGNAVSVTARFPDGSTVNAGNLVMNLLAGGDVVATNAGANLNFTAQTTTNYFLRVASTNAGIRSQYVLDVAISDGVPPAVVSTSLPAPGTPTGAVLDRFTLVFSEDMNPASVTNSASYEARGAGADGLFDTPDDELYVVLPDPYSNGLAAGFTLPDGPLQPGLVRLTARTNLADRIGNNLATPFVRTFSVTNPPNYALESRGNDSFGRATPVSGLFNAPPSGTIGWDADYAGFSGPQFIAAAQLNGDTNLDLAVPNANAGTVTIVTNNGRGQFFVMTNIAVGNNPVSVRAGRFNNDAFTDLAVTRQSASIVTILLGTAGGFVVSTNIPGIPSPYQHVAADFNNDGFTDLAVPRSNGGTLAVLLADGTGGFQAPVTYNVNASPYQIAAGHLNNDTNLDLVVACTSGHVGILLGNGNGSFQPATHYVSGPTTRSVAVTDVDGDGFNDIVALAAGDNTANVLRGNGDGTVQPRVDYPTGTSDGYQLSVGDFTGDGRPEILVAGYSSWNVGLLLNNGGGLFTNLHVYPLNFYPLGAALGDFNGDGRLDAAISRSSANLVSVYLGNALTPVNEDPPASGLRTAFVRGNLTASSDADYFQFTGVAGEQVIVAIENPGAPASSGLRVDVYRVEGALLTGFNANAAGWGQSAVLTLPYTGTYFARVTENFVYRGEYRLRVTRLAPGASFETEDNNTIATADYPVYTQTNHHLLATVAGYVSYGDSAGDFFDLGYLEAGASVALGLRQPASGGFNAILSVYNAAGQIQTNSAAGATNLLFTVPNGAPGYYYARLLADPVAPPPLFGGQPGFALLFNGVDQFVRMPDSPSLRPVNLTLEGWVNFSSVFGLHTLFAKPLGAGEEDAYAVWYNQGQLHAYVSGGPALGFNWAPQLGQWYHVAYVFDDAANSQTLYLDGQVVASGAVNVSLSYDAQPFQIGADLASGSPSYFFPGKIDEVRLWNVVRASNEIASARMQRLLGNEPGLAGYWRLDEGSGLSATDATANGNHGALFNSPTWTASGLNATPATPLASQYWLNVDLLETSPMRLLSTTLPPEGATVSNIWQSFTVRFDEELDSRMNLLNRPIFKSGSSRYIVTDTAGSWADAQAFAVSVGGHLVTVDDANENEFLRQSFAGLGDLWIGLNDRASEGAFAWAGGGSVVFTNWQNGQPDNDGGADAAVLDDASGQWYDDNAGTARRGIVETAAAPDTDGDGVPDGLDLFAGDRLNGFDLRAAGPDGQFDTPDDQIYRLVISGYSRGTNVTLNVADGPLQYGQYRFTATTNIHDRHGNGLASNYVQKFTVSPVPGFVLESPGNDVIAQATSFGTGAPGAMDGSFRLGGSVAAGANPYYLVATNLNGDTNLDLLVANYGGDTLGIYLGQADGSFQLLTNLPVGDGPIGFAVADFNADSHLDLAVALHQASRLAILLGDGTGAFVASTNYVTPAQPYYLVVADFNKDNNLDVATANLNGDNVSIFAGNGNGTFQPRTDIPVGDGCASIATSDLNGDANPDLVVANRYASTFSVLLGNGNGTFQAPASYALTTTAGGLAVQDFNGDGFQDVVALSGGDLNYFAGNGDGTLRARVSFAVGASDTRQVVPADLDANGTIDLVIPSYGNSRLITVLNLGDGLFGGALAYLYTGNPISVALGDFDHDGRLDAATANYNDGRVQFLPGVGGQQLALDSATGLRTIAGRGALFDANDADHWSFSARANDRLVIATESVGAVANSQLHYTVYRPDNSQQAEFYADSNGRAEYSAVLAAAGTYTIRVDRSDNYFGEYRLRVTLAPPSFQYETENNDTLASADPVALTLAGGKQTADLFGYFGVTDPGDYFRLGNLSEGTEVTLRSLRPSTGTVEPVVAIYTAGDVLVARNFPGQTNLSYLIPVGQSGAYYARALPTWPIPPPGETNALRLDGVDDSVRVGNWSPGSKWSVQAWTVPMTRPAGRHAIAGGAGGCLDWGVALIDGRFAAFYRPPGGCSASLTAPDLAELGRWHHVAAACDGTNVQLYVDGAWLGSAPVELNYVPYTGGTWIGGEVCCANYYNGVIGPVSIWNRAVTPAEIAGTLATNLLGTEPGLLGYWRLDEGAGATVSDLSPLARPGTLFNGPSWVSLSPASGGAPGVLAEYRLGIELRDTSPPFVTGVSLPEEGTGSSTVIDRFTISFSEDMAPATVAAGASYLLRHAGPNGVFDATDDSFYTILNSPAYSNGLSASFLLPDGPLQAGLYRFTALTNLTDTSGTALSSNFVRQFSITNTGGFVFENRSNDTIASATSLGTLGASNAGSFRAGLTLPVGLNPQYSLLAPLNGDSHLDLLVPNYGASTISVYAGNGDGTFALKTNFPAAGAGPLQPVLAQFDSDGLIDLAVGNYTAGTVAIYLGHGDGSFTALTNYPTGVNPVGVITGDFNNDSRADLAVANFNGGTVSVLLGNGNGTFQAPVNYPAGGTPYQLATGDFNNDGRLDLVTANANTDNLALFLGNGNGTFTLASTLPVGDGPYSVVAADFNGDNKLDLASGNADGTVSVLAGNGDGSFQRRRNLTTGFGTSYHMIAADLDGNGRLDLAVTGFNQDRLAVFLQSDPLVFEPAAFYVTGDGPAGLAAGDLNEDSRPDLVVANYASHNLTFFLGRGVESLPSDAPAPNGPALPVGLGRGNLQNNADTDTWSFGAAAGDRVQIVIENPGNPGASGRCLDLYGPGGISIDSWCADFNGRGTFASTLPSSGVYFVRVRYNYTYAGEYRLRISVVKPPVQIEVEPNDGVGSANALTFSPAPGVLSATVFGTVHSDDTSGDFFRLGSLAPGVLVQLSLGRPLTSTLSGQLAIYKGPTLVTNSPPGATNLVYSVPVGAGDEYHARVTAAPGTAGLFGQYLLTIQTYDGEGPLVTSTTLPAGGSSSPGLIDRFTVNFSEELDPGLARLSRRPLRYNGHAYLRSTSSGSWFAAEEEARSLGGHLATVNDAAENQWILDNFGINVWLGLSDEAVEGTFTWANGEPVNYLNWNTGEPSNTGNEDYAVLLSTGRWNDEGPSASHNGVIELAGPDTDGDGLVDAADVFPLDPLNLFDLRAAGPDAAFDTPDDEVYTVLPATYVNGTSLPFTVLDGPLQPGLYRFRVTTSLRDRFGHTPFQPYDQLFTIASVPPFVVENRDNNVSSNATVLSLEESPAGFRTGLGRGKLFSAGDTDYWSFTAGSNDVLTLATETVGSPGSSGLRYRVLNPAGVAMVDFNADFNGFGQAGPVTLTNNGSYRVVVTANYAYLGEHRFRVSIASPPIQLESEANNTIAAADPLALQVNGESRFASAAGVEDAVGDLDYFNLGTITNGSSVFLNVRLPNSSTFLPVVALYNASGQYQNEVPGGRAGDGIAEVQILSPGTYYALVRGGGGSVPGLRAQYVLDVQVVPTGSVSFPNLQVTGLTLPGGAPVSGQSVSFGFTVANIGQLATPVANWIDRAVFSTNAILGDADDLPLGFFPHLGALSPGAGYGVSNSFALPDGISGDYYLIVQTDAGNALNEFIFESDNITVSAATFHVSRAPYPDLKVESLQLAGPNSNGTYTVSWTTANRGDAPAPGGFRDRFLVRNLNTAQILASVDLPAPAGLAVNATIARQSTVTTTNPGNYQVQIGADFLNEIYEFDAVSHANAENNTVTTNFAITQFYTVAVAANPTNAGAVAGGGSFASGTPVTVTAVANTNARPYYFVNWTEAGVFQSATPDYAFTLTRARDLVANFTLPAYAITVSNHPPAAGSVSGQGTYFHGTTNVLAATPNFGYTFANWTENGQLISLLPALTNVVTSNRFLVANYTEANTFHVVTTATSPANVAPVTGAGVFSNGQSVTISSPASVTNPPNLYAFREFRLNGAPAGNSPAFLKTFSTLDPTNLQYVAVYDVSSILPVLVSAYGGFTNTALGGFTVVTNPVPASTNYRVTLQFDRPMNPAITPLILISNASTAVQPLVPPGGAWFATALNNDTYRTPFITFSNGMDGAASVRVLAAQDPGGLVMTPTNVLALRIDVTPPDAPPLSLTASNDTSATVSWTAYSAPPDLGSFRVYLAPSNFISVSGLAPLTTLAGAARAYPYQNLSLDTAYYAAIVAVDQAGNSRETVTPLSFVLPRAIPPPAAIQVTATDPSSAAISWSGYSTANLLGFAGFWLFYETNDFTTVAGLTPRQTLGPGARSAQAGGLDRLLTYHFAVVGFNSANGSNPLVTTKPWSDPFAGQIAGNLTVGGTGQTVDILQPMMVVSNAVLTVQPGTTLRFAPGAGVFVQQGRLTANGTALDPVVFTSLNDQTGLTPNAGDWSGVTLGSGAGLSLLRHVFIKFGAGLTLSNCAPTVDAFTAFNNTPAGLTLLGNATLTTAQALIAFNDVGAQQSGAAQLNVHDSVLKNNPTNALAAGGASLVATQNWWGSAAQADIDATLQGNVNRANFLAGEPLLTPALGASNGVTQVGSRNVNLRLACRTADAMRLSEDSAFFAAFYQSFNSQTSFQLSEGGGLKTVFAQFRSVTGQTSPPVSITFNYITAGPTIGGFSLSEGQLLGRPLAVTGSASAPLGMAAMEFYVDNAPVGTNAGGSLSQRFDVRNLTNGVHRVKLVARDTSGNFATRELNVTVVLTPPPAPLVTSPGADLIVSSNSVNLRGAAEPLISIRLVQNNSPVAATAADAAGNWAFDNVPLVEGNNTFAATAFDALGSAASASRNVVRDSGPPAPLVLAPLVYNPVDGLSLSWTFPTNGERAAFFRVYWHTNSFLTPAQAGGQSALLTSMSYRLFGITPGSYFFGVVGYDTAGNVSALSNLRPFLYDPNPPSFVVSFNKAAPVGAGPLRIALVASEPLFSAPSLTLFPSRSAPVALTLSNTALNTYEGVLNVTPATPSGPLGLAVAGRDLSGNLFNGPPAGPPMEIDVQPPAGVIATAPPAPVQATNPTDVTVSLTLSEPVKNGTTPVLGFNPPVGPAVPIALTGSGSNWVGTLGVTPAMGSGNGTFSLTATDALDNVGQLITSGRSLEIYNTALPAAPGQPVNFHVASLSGGRVQLSWNAVSNAEIYRVYAQPGTNFLLVPTNLVADNVVSNSYIDLPPADGSFLYVVTAARRGSEGTNSITRVALSDRTPPPAPAGLNVQLLSGGVRVSWQPGAGEAPDSYRVYRNGVRLRTTTGTSMDDSPPRGVMSYAVAAADSLGNEALSAPAAIELFVGAVNNLVALSSAGQAPLLTWTSTDGTAVGFNVYRNGVKQNAAPLSGPQFTDPIGVPAGGVVHYTVRAVNATNAESAPRSVDLYDAALDLFANLAADTEQPLVNFYFDNFLAVVSNRTTGAALPLGFVQLRRTIAGQPSVTRSNEVHDTVAAAGVLERNLVLPAAGVTDPQSYLVRAYQEPDLGGSLAIYENTFGSANVVLPANMIEVTAAQQPLAGGLATLSLLVFNRGHADMDLLVTRHNGADPGDLSITVRNPFGAEVSRADYAGVPPGTIFTADGRGYVRVPAGASKSISVPNVLVPEALGTNAATFTAVFNQIYYHLGAADEAQSGPISGSMVSTLAVTPYFGAAQTDRQLYADDDPILISGQAIERQTGQPKPNAPLKLGFAIAGARFWLNVTSDISGGFQYTYQPPPGMSGTLKIWAAHPDVFDTLSQAEVKLYRCYLSPANVDLRMSKNGTQRFFLTLINTGDELLTGFALTSQAYQFVETDKVPIDTVTAAALLETNFVLGPRSTERVSFELQAQLDAPDNALVEFVLRSAEGASAKFRANLTLLQANPLLVVTDPAVGYVEASVDRGDLRSRSVTLVNRGLRPLEGVTLQAPTNVPWMSVNLPADASGVIHLPDLPIGSTNSFTVVFAPPLGTALDVFQDKLRLQGTNSPATFEVSLYATVTSSLKGGARFYVDDILVEPVPNATVRIKNTLIEQEYTLHTDANGFVTAPDLQEGPWAWQVTAPGHSAQVGVVEVIPDQTVLVETRLSRALVTVNFSVVPVPYTDRYEITIEQVFETHVPAPVLVLTPPHMDFQNVSPGFEATYILTAKNYGLIQMTDVTFRGMRDGRGGVLSPLINYVPVLRAQESIEIPMRFTFQPGTPGTNQTGGGSLARSYGERRKNLTRDVDENGNITGGVQFPPSFGDNASPGASFADCATGGLGGLGDFLGGLMAIANGCATCADLRTALAVAASAAVTYSLLCAPTFSPLGLLPSPCPSGGPIGWVISFFINLASCACQALGCFGADSGGGGAGPGSPAGPQGFAQYAPAGPGCFAAGTLVTLADGALKPIEQVVAGDRVKTGLTGRESASVREVESRQAAELWQIEFAQGLLRASAEHEFWVDGKGWTAARQLQPGDWLMNEAGSRVRLAQVRRIPGAIKVYTFLNAGDHVFYANGVLVRDSCGNKGSPFQPASNAGPPRFSPAGKGVAR